MKKILCVLVCVLAAGIAWGQEEFPHPSMEMVTFAPATYLGTTVVFDKATFQPTLKKITYFDTILYCLNIRSDLGNYYTEVYYSFFPSEEINFYVTEKFAGELIFKQIAEGNYPVNITCTVEQKTALYRTKEYSCWMCKVIKIDMLDKDGNIIETYTETGASLPTNPCEAGILSERNRWDVGGDNVMGLPEAIRALQIAVQK